MEQHDIIRYMKRFPDKIGESASMKSKLWKCGKCNINFKTENEVCCSKHSPCRCGSIFFIKGK